MRSKSAQQDLLIPVEQRPRKGFEIRESKILGSMGACHVGCSHVCIIALYNPPPAYFCRLDGRQESTSTGSQRGSHHEQRRICALFRL